MGFDDIFVEIEFDHFKGDTDAAICIVIDGEEHWLPKSQTGRPDYKKEPGTRPGSVEVAEWLAIDRGLV